MQEMLWVDAHQLRPGIFIELDLGWLAHPFLSSRFRIANPKQIQTIIGLKVERVRCVKNLSDAQAWQSLMDDLFPAAVPTNTKDAKGAQLAASSANEDSTKQNKPVLDEKMRALLLQNTALQHCQRRFDETLGSYRAIWDSVQPAPMSAGDACRQTVEQLSEELNQSGDFSIRLLRQTQADAQAMHPVNVTVLSMLLGRTLGVHGNALVDLGSAAFLHDIGKVQAVLDDEHVAVGVSLAERMGMNEAVISGIAQHHEMFDGSGFPKGLKADELSLPGRIVALVNFYDRLCNQGAHGGAKKLTPHEALATIFAQYKHYFDPMVLSSFIRMMGVYPPGSVVQLIDDRYALVHAVNSSRPLKPRVLVHDPDTPADQALVLDLEVMPRLGIRRSVRPSVLSAEAFAYLAPAASINYFFESHSTDAALA